MNVESLDKKPATKVGSKTRKEQLLTSAEIAIMKYGMSTSMDQIASEAGITKPILYRHFKDRTHLLLAIQKRYEDKLVKELAERLYAHPITSPQNAKDLVYEVIDTYLTFVQYNLAIYRYLTRQDFPEVSAETLGLVKKISTNVAEVIKQALLSFNLSSKPAKLWAHAIVGMVHAAADWWVDDQSLTKDQFVRYLGNLLWNGLNLNNLNRD